MKKNLLLLPVVAMWGCTDYVGDWDDKYGTAFNGNSNTAIVICEDGSTTSITEGSCVTDFLCVNNAWLPQNTVCNNVQQQKVCEDGQTTYFTYDLCTNYFVCSNNSWVIVGEPICTTPVSLSSSSVVKLSSSSAKSSSSVVKSSSSSAKSSSSVVKSSSSLAKSSSSVAKSSSSVAVSRAFPTWLGSDGLPRIETGLDAGLESSGYWFSFTDDSDRGKSEIVWGGPLGNEYDANAFDNVVLACNGLCGTAKLDRGDLEMDPFVGLGFYVAGLKSDKGYKLVAADASAWGGICITYISEVASRLELGLGDNVDASIGYANPSVILPKSTAGTKKALAWSDFKQPSWYKGAVKIDGPTAAAQLVAVKLFLTGSTGSYKFNICAVGPYNGACPTSCTVAK